MGREQSLAIPTLFIAVAVMAFAPIISSGGDGRNEKTEAATPVSTSAKETTPIGSITLGGGASVVTSHTVAVELSLAPGANSETTEMRWSFNGASWSEWIPFASPQPITFGRDGHRTIWFQLRSKTGTTSPPLADSIIIATKKSLIFFDDFEDGSQQGQQ